MARKYDLITELYTQAAKKVTSDPENWMAFLRSACRNFRLPFDEQLLIFEQRPDATAVLEIEDWNKKFGRWVRRGAKGIAVFDKTSVTLRLKHYFDISDTEESRYTHTIRPVPVWEMRKDYQQEVQESVSKLFGVTDGALDFEETIIEAAKNAATDNLVDYLQDILNFRENSFLEDLDGQSVETVTRHLLEYSIAYMMMVRCNLEPDRYIHTEDFRDIIYFNTTQLVNLFGTVTSDISEIALGEISRVVNKLQMEEKRKDRTFAPREPENYNEDETRENANDESKIERGFYDDGNQLQQTGRLPVTEPDRTGTDTGAPWEIRLTAIDIPEEPPLRYISESADTGKIKGTSGRNTDDRTEQDRTSSGRDGENTESQRAAERTRSDDLAWNDEQYPEGSGRNNNDGNHLRLNTHELDDGDKSYENGIVQSTDNVAEEKSSAFDISEKNFSDEGVLGQLNNQMKPLPNVNKQLSMIEETADSKVSAFSFTQEVIDQALATGSGFKDGKYRIYAYFLQEHTDKEKADFLKKEYGTGGRSSILSESEIGEDHDYRGLTLHCGYGDHAPKILLKWPQVAKRISELIVAGRYMSEREIERIPEYEKGILAAEIYHFYYNQPESVARPYPYAADYYAGIKAIRPQLDMQDKVEKILSSMTEVFDSTADFDRNYASMQKAIRDLTSYRDGRYSLFTPISAEIETQVMPEPVPEQRREEVIAMKPRYDLQTDTVVYIGADKYEIQFLSDETVVLHDLKYPLFTKEMSRGEFEKKLRENPVNDHLQIRQAEGNKELPAEKNTENSATHKLIEDIQNGLPVPEVSAAPIEPVVESDIENVSAQPEQALIPAWTKPKPVIRTKSFDLHPEVPRSERLHYHIDDDMLGQGTLKEKFRANIQAIQLLKKCEAEDRYATAEEQKILSGYVGWGGLADAFDETKSSWSYEYLELRSILTEEEYAAARQSTLTAFYTPPVVIRAMYQALENMGLRSGNILEPSCGIGNFIGMRPDSLSDCHFFGIEIDSISGRIAQQLYQQSAIAVQGYEEAQLPDSFYDAAIGNVPFGQFKVMDKRYDKYHFSIHDYFFAKTLDKVRPGGVVAFITSSHTLDKKTPDIRKYIAQRAEFLGAIRLPNDTFKKNAGTEVTSDIIFLQKRDRMIDVEPDWVYLDTDEKGIPLNSYFIQHPKMIMGEMVMESTQYGMDSTCRPYHDADLESLLTEAIHNIHAEITEYEAEELGDDNTIPADPAVANFSYTVVEGNIYYRENSRMKPVKLSVTASNRVKGMIAIRDCVRELIAYQTEDASDIEIEAQQKMLNSLYDRFTKQYGLLNARANCTVFNDDNSYPLLCSLEILKDDGTLERKADMFIKRTIKPHQTVSRVDTASEALSLSLAEKARVDMDYMSQLTGKNADEIEQELKGVIFRLPSSLSCEMPQFVSEDEYLSGNVRKKLDEARMAAQISKIYDINVEALEKVQPKDLSASEISVRLGTTWIPEDDIKEFVFDLLQPAFYLKHHIKVRFSSYTGEWRIERKNADNGNVKANNTYGTARVNAYKIIEDSLNLRNTRVYDYVEDENGKRTPVLNTKETAIAQSKQDIIKQAFTDWIWKEPERRQRLTEDYNRNFNAIKPREYDGSHLHFYGMNPEIVLRQHQKNGVARIIYGGNTLLAYVVGAGKTYTMVAAAMESKRLGLCNKSMVVVPNHIIEQFAAEWLQLYPAANLLVARKSDFSAANRKKFCARIATSDIDAVIIGHSQFEKIPLSIERQQRMIQEEIDEIIRWIEAGKRENGDKFSIKQMEKAKKSLETRLNKLNDRSRKDDVVNFEELGIDRLFVDEADAYKNLYLHTKMRNVGGIATSEAQKSTDMFMKCRYLNELTGGRGVVFATGTPISNSMVEMYTMQRYLQYHVLEEHHLQHFDAWASTFGETIEAIELAPEGTGYRMKTRFAKFFNLPELMMMFREVADIQTADMLNLPVPEAEYRVISVKPSDMQKELVEDLGDRAEQVRNNLVSPKEDNMLKITNDGRKIALDQRLVNAMLFDEPESKVNACVNEIYRFWHEGEEKSLTQLVFCDLSTPKSDGFSVYNDVRDKLIAKGIPPNEIEFIHNANTEVRKKELFSKVRRGAVRVLMGSTFKMGAGTNVQDLIIASHDLDCPWRPRDLEQRAGRTIRQGNKNKTVNIIRYVTEGTFDAYLYQIIENKQKFISQIMTSKSPARVVEDIDEVALSYAEIKALATGNPLIKEKMDLDVQVSKLQLLKQSFLSQRYELEDKIIKYFPSEIKKTENMMTAYQADIERVRMHTPSDREVFPPMLLAGTTYTDKQEAGKAIIELCQTMRSPDPVEIGAYRGLVMELEYRTIMQCFAVTLIGKAKHMVLLGSDIYGNITRIDNEIAKFEDKLAEYKANLENTKTQFEMAKVEVGKPFSKEQELAEKTARLAELNALLDLDKTEHVMLDAVDGKDAPEPERAGRERER